MIKQNSTKIMNRNREIFRRGRRIWPIHTGTVVWSAPAIIILCWKFISEKLLWIWHLDYVCYFIKKILKIPKGWKYGKKIFEVSHVRGMDFRPFWYFHSFDLFEAISKKDLICHWKAKKTKNWNISSIFIFNNVFTQIYCTKVGKKFPDFELCCT